MEDKVALYAVEALKVVMESHGEGNIWFVKSESSKEDVMDAISKEAKGWLALMLSGGFLPMLAFKFGKAKVEGKNEKIVVSSEWVISYFVWRILSDTWEDNENLESDMKNLIREKKKPWQGIDLLKFFKRLSNVDTAMEKSEIVEAFLMHFSRIGSALASGEGNKESEK